MRNIAQNLKWLRSLTGLSQQKFCENVGLKKSDWANWELGNYNPRPEMVNKIAEYFNVTTDALMYTDLSTSEIAEKKQYVEEDNVTYGLNLPPEKIDVGKLLAYIELLKKENGNLTEFIDKQLKIKI